MATNAVKPSRNTHAISLHDWVADFAGGIARSDFRRIPNGWRVALLDSSLCWSHPVFDGASINARDFTAGRGLSTATGHGTLNASILIGQGNGWLKGIVPNAHLIHGRVLGLPELRQTALAIAHAVRWAVHQQAESIVMPFGVRKVFHVIRDELERARSRGCTIIAAAGNRGPDVTHFPAILPFVRAVGALDATGEPLLRCCNRQVDLFAPGENVPAVGTYGLTTCTGTSPAAVIAAGLLASKRILK